MSTDKTTPKMGHLLDGTEDRDAIHVAVLPVVTAMRLRPAEHVGIVDGLASAHAETTIGIIDPFLKESVAKGERCFLCLYPGTITSLRHDWAHPEVDSRKAPPALTLGLPTVADSERWLRDLCKRSGLYEGGYEALINDHLVYGRDDIDTSGDFWLHYKNVTGESFAEFSCSC